MNLKQLLCISIISLVLLASGCIGCKTTVQRYDVMEYNLGLQYFIYIDGNDIIRMSSSSTTVKIIKSNETYVNEIITSMGPFGSADYELYINTTGVQI